MQEENYCQLTMIEKRTVESVRQQLACWQAGTGYWLHANDSFLVLIAAYP
jgi:hypothetical protein